MQDDLASRISDGSIAVLELLPGEARFADLSNYVLRGGASRFAPVIVDDEPVRYVLPVGVPGAQLDFGTLILQRSRCAVVWKPDPMRPYRALIMELGPQTTVSQSVVTVRGEAWGRFDLRRDGSPDLTFLVPPVASAALPRMLRRVLVDEPRSRAQRLDVQPLRPEVTDPPAPPAKAAAPAARPAAADVAPPAARPEPTSAPTTAATGSASPAARPPAASESPADPDATRPLPAVARPTPRQPASTPAPSPVGSDQVRWTPREGAEPTDGVLADDSLFRGTQRTAPTPAPLAAVPAAVGAPVPAPVPPRPAPAAAREPVDVVEADDDDEVPPATADGLKGFLTGFGVSIVLGGVLVLGRIVGFL